MKQITLRISTFILAIGFALALMGMGAAPKKTPVGKDTREVGEQTPEPKAVEFVWVTDFDKALAAAKESQKPIFAFFTGSDWCPWCIKFESEISSKEEFQDYAKNTFVLFKADFPRTKKIESELRKKNADLAEKYEVEGFPTVLLLDPDGKKIVTTGYRTGGVEAYIDHLKSLMKEWQDAQKAKK